MIKPIPRISTRLESAAKLVFAKSNLSPGLLLAETAYGNSSKSRHHLIGKVPLTCTSQSIRSRHSTDQCLSEE